MLIFTFTLISISIYISKSVALISLNMATVRGNGSEKDGGDRAVGVLWRNPKLVPKAPFRGSLAKGPVVTSLFLLDHSQLTLFSSFLSDHESMRGHCWTPLTLADL